MKRFLFFIVVILWSCHRLQDATVSSKQASAITNVDSLDRNSPREDDVLNDDTGYFKDRPPGVVEPLSQQEDYPLFDFINKNLDKKELIVLNQFGMSHSCRISPDNTLRVDTLISGQTAIIQKLNKDKEKMLLLEIDGYPIKLFNGKESLEDPLHFYASTFRHFSFKKKEYYYVSAQMFHSFGTSMGNTCYHLLYAVKEHQLSIFYTYRVQEILFGDANGDNALDFLDFNNDGMSTTVPTSNQFAIQLYSDNGKGRFIMQRDKKGNPYYINGNSGLNVGKMDSLNISGYYWPVKLKL